MIDKNFEKLLKNIKITQKEVNFFDIISPKEVIVSEWLAFILDPSKNGVGNITITKLLESINIEYNLHELNFIETNTELVTDKGQRMDIVIKYDKLWIVIENKIESKETGSQTEDYYNYVESIKENNTIIYIYLKPNYNKSIPKKIYSTDNGFIILTYSSLIKKLKEISEFDYYERDKYKYLKEFIVSGDRFMKNEKIEYNEAVMFYINNKQKMEDIEKEYKKQNKKLHEKLRYDVLNLINEYSIGYKTDDGKGINPRTYIQYYKEGWKNENYNGAHFEILFQNEKILSDQIECNVVLHLENHITEEYLEKLKEKGIAKNRSLAFDINKNCSILYNLKLDFSSYEQYEISLKTIVEAFKKLITEYENMINKAFMNNTE